MGRTTIRGTGALIALTMAALALTACSQSQTKPPHTAQSAAPATAGVEQAAKGARPPAGSTPVADTGGAAAPAVAPAPASCAEQRTWTTVPDDGGFAMSPAALYLVRAGRHACYDRVVFDVNGPDPVGFIARYVPVVTSDARGDPVPVAGNAALEVVVRAPVTDADGHQPLRPEPVVGDALVARQTLQGWDSLRAVTFAGSFEGQSTFAIGVREQRPFRMSVIGDQGYRRVILDIAH